MANIQQAGRWSAHLWPVVSLPNCVHVPGFPFVVFPVPPLPHFLYLFLPRFVSHLLVLFGSFFPIIFDPLVFSLSVSLKVMHLYTSLFFSPPPPVNVIFYHFLFRVHILKLVFYLQSMVFLLLLLYKKPHKKTTVTIMAHGFHGLGIWGGLGWFCLRVFHEVEASQWPELEQSGSEAAGGSGWVSLS